jgi:hypothetical protein
VAVLTDVLAGSWSVTRAINGAADAFTGVANFTPGVGRLWWRERGELRLGDYVGDAWRTYLIVPCGDAWEVRFDDGRPFHALDLRSGGCEAVHPCGPDIYRGVYALAEPDRFTVTWRVTGPGRDDTIASDYRRLGSGSGPPQGLNADHLRRDRAARRSPSTRTSA